MRLPLPFQPYMWGYRALAYMLILPWPEVTDAHQEWERKGAEVETLMLGATTIFRQIHQNPSLLQNTQVLEQGMYTCMYIDAVCVCVRGCVTSTLEQIVPNYVFWHCHNFCPIMCSNIHTKCFKRQSPTDTIGLSVCWYYSISLVS